MSQRFAVAGAGTMGAGIAYVAAGSGYEVTLVEIDEARGRAAVDGIRDWARKAVERGRSTSEEAAATLERLRLVTEFTDVDPEPAVFVEAVPERPELKHQVLAAAEQLRPELLASNTSSISIDSLAARLEAPERFCGLHFFNPVYAMALLEIVIGDKTSDASREAALAVARRLGKEPVVVRDSPGFATSRLGNALGLEAIRMLESGVASAADIDKAMSLGYRHPMGPLELSDVVGLDVRLDIARSLQAAYGDRFEPPRTLIDLVAQGKLGKKSGQGFYTWVDGKKVEG
ncbi:3-hydroxyacyl-CoA dehydrogenase family protein [Stackebrandtia nassauensis]|uniref:3-hydroxyacyl-CoA dehydrogenase n=1 Tax=Stackebrandtia nassauensis (strain DSM 44728 / CIP 108903 / NRRL B-16338 / NBRC 102104 / LLR-40K-21) TaxID=446470 RepID=D3Q006_STANL|nr:3-hydroxyacyl-CoA dehydrogenase family protein [Stackebrandtia nassauensis]ADD45535.1 3-hydroxyacyl-CoA dehydrogenase [Stackebrandtia nassauensis DSM 44728]